jgi:hypothetical protein
MYVGMNAFIEENDSKCIKHKLDLLKNNVDLKDNREQEQLILLKLYKDMRKMDKNRMRYIRKAKKYKQQKIVYNTNHDIASDINNLLNTKNKDIKTMSRYINNIYTDQKIIDELIIYKLLYHIPEKKIKVCEDNYIDIIGNICSILNSVTPLLVSYIEDHVWIINHKSTRNFIVPKKKVLLTNTIPLKVMKNTNFRKYMSMITGYLTKCYDGSIKYNIEEDSKYDFAWVFISIRYGNNN